MRVFLVLMFCLNGYTICKSQTAQYKVIYTPQHITYNGSDNPNECWESVEWGLEVVHQDSILFFNLPFSVYKELEEKL
ncbi:MAG: hypothetical protein IPM77_07670 [Crocinitomicaceae bacterium]|nr:hypothetical protein [Crocinitomicaceae bacterium]